MKFLVSIMALLCVVLMHQATHGQCINGQCYGPQVGHPMYLMPNVIIVETPVMPVEGTPEDHTGDGQTKTQMPQPRIHVMQPCPDPRFMHCQPGGCQPYYQPSYCHRPPYQCGNGFCGPAMCGPAPFHADQSYRRTVGIGLNLSWNSRRQFHAH